MFGLSRRRGSTRLRLTILLTLALLPIGVISVFRASLLVAESRDVTLAAVRGAALEATAPMRAQIEGARGAAQVLAQSARARPLDGPACTNWFDEALGGLAAPIVAAATFQPDGSAPCRWGNIPMDGPGQRVVNALKDWTIFIDGTDADAPDASAGRVTLALRVGGLQVAMPAAPLDLTLVNQFGKPWTHDSLPKPTPATTPVDVLQAAPPLLAQEWHGLSEDGSQRDFVVLRLSDNLFALASQPSTAKGLAALPGLSAVLPLLMWGASLLVAVAAVNRMILDPLRQLRGQMTSFAGGGRDLPPLQLDGAPGELVDAADSFRAMTDQIAADEARLAKSLQDRDILLKEVHHRVKNNLQLIASILNMQIREAQAPSTQAILERVRARVMGLALVHQHLYRAEELALIRADTLLREITNRALPPAVQAVHDIHIDLAPLSLYPDQAVPLALLIGEAMANVQTYAGAKADSPVTVHLAMCHSDEGTVTLRLSNSMDPDETDLVDPKREGLGLRLIRAFAQQLDATLDRSFEGQRHSLTLIFTAVDPSGVALSPDDFPQ